MKFNLKSIAAGLLVAGSAASAYGSAIDDLFATRNANPYLLTDLSGEIVVDGDENTGNVGTNDYLVGALGFESFSNPNSTIALTGRELTAVFATQITNSAALTAATSDFIVGAAGKSFWTNQFFGGIGAAADAFELTYGVDLNKVAGLVYDDTSVAGFDRGNGIAAGFAEASDGALRMIIGFDGLDDYWFARGFSSLADFATGSTTNAVGQFNFGLSIFYEDLSVDFNDFTSTISQDDLDSGGYLLSTIINPVSATVGLAGDGSLFRPSAPNTGVTDPFPVYDKVDITLNSVPEPSTLALAGLAFLGFGMSRRKRTC